VPKVKFTKADDSTEVVEIDDKTLHLGGEPVELTQDQYKRVQALDGLSFSAGKGDE